MGPVGALFLLCGCAAGKEDGVLTRTGFLLDAFVTVTLYGSRDERALDGAITPSAGLWLVENGNW